MKVKNCYIKYFSDLPVTLELGCKYFVEETGEIIVDFGNGPISFGKDIGLSDEATFIGESEPFGTNYDVLYIQ